MLPPVTLHFAAGDALVAIDEVRSRRGAVYHQLNVNNYHRDRAIEDITICRPRQ